MALTSPDEEGEMATNALVVLQVISIVILTTMSVMPMFRMVLFQKDHCHDDNHVEYDGTEEKM